MDWSQCKFGYKSFQGDGSIKIFPCEILSKLDDRFVKIRYYIIIHKKDGIIQIDSRESTVYWHYIDNWKNETL